MRKLPGIGGKLFEWDTWSTIGVAFCLLKVTTDQLTSVISCKISIKLRIGLVHVCQHIQVISLKVLFLRNSELPDRVS